MDNKAILTLMGYSGESEWPLQNIWKPDLVMWRENITALIENEIGDNWKTYIGEAERHFGQPGGLKKNPLAISRALELAWAAGDRSPSLERLAHSVILFAEKSVRE